MRCSVALITILSLQLVGCHAASTPAHRSAATTHATTQPAEEAAMTPAQPAPKFADCPQAEQLVDRTGYVLAPRAKYRAQQVPGAVIVMVEGETSTPGYVVKLSMNPVRIYPPQFTLYQKPPTGMVPQVMTPFDVCAKFGADNRDTINSVTIFDAEGRVDVPAEKVLD